MNRDHNGPGLRSTADHTHLARSGPRTSPLWLRLVEATTGTDVNRTCNRRGPRTTADHTQLARSGPRTFFQLWRRCIERAANPVEGRP
jgi:hypothetical protein